MQQQQLAAQLAQHGNGGRQPQLSPTPSDSDSDISLGAHSPPISSPGPIKFGRSSPNPITSFRFGAHSPGPMPPQFRFGGTHTPPAFSPNFRIERPKDSSSTSPINVDNSSYTAVNLRLSSNESPIDVDSTDKELKSNSPPQTTLQHSPPMNLRIADNLRMHNNDGKIETPLPLRLNHHQQPLRIQVSSPGQIALSSPLTSIHGGYTHGGIVRIAPPSPNNNNNIGHVLHRPFSPPRLT